MSPRSNSYTVGSGRRLWLNTEGSGGAPYLQKEREQDSKSSCTEVVECKDYSRARDSHCIHMLAKINMDRL